jgi:Caenorhabditis protein of unknown function, DUF268
MNKNYFKLLYANLKSMGIDPLVTLFFFRGLLYYIYSLIIFRVKLKKKTKFYFRPILHDKYLESGVMKGHYFHQDLFVAKKIYENCPVNHLDIGSRTDGFVAHIAVFRKINILDIRNQSSNVENIVFKRADLMDANFQIEEIYDSVSCLHAIEHFGLGRYGDSLDVDGHLIAFKNIHKIISKNGKFYFSTLFGYPRIEFNAHRVFELSFLFNWVKEFYEIESFSYVDDSGDLHKDVYLKESDLENNLYQNYACAIFILVKK